MAGPGDIGIGAVLGGTYQITALLGRGGMGAVWSANHLRLPGKRVAVKVLHAANQNDESYARFRREAEIASRIGHPNIVEVLDWNMLPDGTPYLVLEYLEGESLSARLDEGPIPLDETMMLVRQIGSALHAAHRAGVVHRDLKPDNIYLCPTDAGGHLAYRVKILDFGVSKIRNSTTFQTQEARVLGTPQYMAPEQATGRNQEVDQRADVFALGVIVYEMLSGRGPFQGDNVAAVIFQVVYEEPPPLASLVPGLPPNVTAAVHRALSKTREGRQPDVLTFVAELTGQPLDTLDRGAFRLSRLTPTAYAQTEAQVARGTPANGPASPPARRGLPTWVKALGLLAVAGAGAAIALVAIGNRAAAPDAPDARPPALVARPPTTLVATTADHPPAIAIAAADASVRAARAPDAGAALRADAGGVHLPLARADAGHVRRDAAAARPDAGLPMPPRTPRPPRLPLRPSPLPKTPPPQPAAERRPPRVVIAELLRAERAVAGGDYQTALRLARHSLMEHKTSRAYSVMARAYCGLRDLGNAKAALHNVVGRERLRVFRRCRRLGFPIN